MKRVDRLDRKWLQSLVAGARRIASTPRLRSEVGWVIAHRAVEFGFLFGLLKVLTNGLGKGGYGEYNLAEASLVLVASILITPVHEAYLRDYHGAIERGERRAAGIALCRWYAGVTIGTSIVLAALSTNLSHGFGIGQWTAFAAGLLFLGDRWRALGHEWLNIERQRRAGALWNLAYYTTQICLLGLVFRLGRPTAAAALAASAVAAILFGGMLTGPLVRSLLRAPMAGRSRVGALVLSFGVPFALLQLFQWVQGFSDRYLVKALLDPASVGLYVAAYQVTGVPFVLIQRIAHELLIPIAYQRSHDLEDPGGLWAADRLILAGLAGQLALGSIMLALYGVLGTQLLVALTNEAYALPATTIAVLAGARFAQAFSLALQSIFAVHRAMSRVIWFRAAGAILTPVVCWITIPAWGVSGAALGTLVSFLIFLAVLAFAPGGCLALVREGRRHARTPMPRGDPRGAT